VALPPRMICARCGYDRRNVYARDPYLPCPECGDDGCPGELKPWPPPVKVLWRLIRWPLVAVCAAFALFLLFLRASGITPCLGEVAVFTLFVIVGIAPFAAMGEFVERHCPENRRTAVSFGLVVLGWGGSVVLLAALVLACVVTASILR
jgi:hypothetical protein